MTNEGSKHVRVQPGIGIPRLLSGVPPVVEPQFGGAMNPSPHGVVEQEVAWFTDMFSRIVGNIGQRIHGKAQQVSQAALALVSEGHLLLEDVPGVGKTSLARAMSESISGSWSRLQFTPDLLPSDVTGISIWNQATQCFEFRPGPVFSNLVIGDEINRASPKTQSALLEVMEERQVTVDGSPRAVPRPFVVIATQNPIDMDGTYNMPEAQLDRFLLKMSMGYPDAVAEARIVIARHGGAPGPLDPVVSLEQISEMIRISSRIRLDRQIVEYVVTLVQATRRTADIRLGASPRGTIGLLRSAQSLAASEGRSFVIADDVKRLAIPVLAHRLLVAPDAQLRGVTALQVVTDLLNGIRVPGGVT